MRKRIYLLAAFLLLLFVIGEIFGFKTRILEKRIDLYTDNYAAVRTENRNLSVQYYNALNLSKIDEIARTKLKMIIPNSYVIIELDNAK
jgi:cell division protein FtsL